MAKRLPERNASLSGLTSQRAGENSVEPSHRGARIAPGLLRLRPCPISAAALPVAWSRHSQEVRRSQQNAERRANLPGAWSESAESARMAVRLPQAFFPEAYAAFFLPFPPRFH